MKFVTLGPEGTCHENATRHYVRYHGVENAEIVLVKNFFDGLEMLHDGEANYLIQNSAHLNVHLITEKYYQEIPVIDTFIYQTGEMALLENIEVEQPRTLGLVQATEGYLDGITYPEMTFEVSKPIVGKNLLEGKYDAGLTYLHYYTNNPGRFRLRKYIGVVITAWLVYGREMTYKGEVMGALAPGFYHREDIGAGIPVAARRGLTAVTTQ